MVTTYFLNDVMGNVFKTKTSPALPTSYYIGLSSTAPTLAGGNVTEPSSSSGYARVKLTTLSAPANGVITNSGDITFPESTGNWGTLSHFVVYDSATGGNLLMYDQLTSSRTVESGTVVAIKSGKLNLTLANAS